MMVNGQRRGRLRFAGAMTNLHKAKLENISNLQTYREGVQLLYDAPRKFIARHVRTFSVPDFEEKLDGLPAGLQFPKALKGKIYFDTAADPSALHFVGAMTEQERDVLLVLSTDPADPHHAPYQAAVNGLFAQADTVVPAPGDAFLSASGLDNDAAAMFDSATAPEDRFLRLLKKLLPYLRRTLSERLVVERIAEALKLETRVTETVLRELVSPANPGRRALDEFLDPAFAESDPQVKPSERAFPAQFSTFTLLHKVAMVVTKFDFTHRQVKWLFTHGPKAGWLDLNTLPIDATKPAAPFDRWLRLAALARLRDRLPQGEHALEELFAHVGSVSAASPVAEKNAAKQAWVAALVRWTQWSESDLETLLGKPDDHADTGQLAAVFPADYLGERLLAGLRECFSLLKRLGMPAELSSTLAGAEVTADTARKVQQAVRAKYDEAQWLNLAKPLRDVLREKQRAALVTYLVSYAELSQNVCDANDLYAHFLID
ncbi:MAG: hypothetical protein L0099_06720, partial [Acidobacteria bacterium]|nr:hypothetical protein [Acidobacteriota bacterium]